MIGEAWYEVDGRRRPLPDGVSLQQGPVRTGSREATERNCVFIGSTDERDAAGPAPGFEDLRQRAPVPPEEREALEALYKTTGGDHWTHRVGWLGPAGTECNWHGVMCLPAADAVRVFGLALADNNLAGEIPAAVGQLSKLESLDLSRNRLRGEIPSSIGQLSELETLDLNSNRLAGEIPVALGRLERIRWLLLYGNRFTGILPDPLIQKWLAGPLAISAEAQLLTDISEIDSEWDPPALLCASHRIILRADKSVVSYTTRCRSSSPNDRATFCEVKSGHTTAGEFARLGWLFEKNGFFDFGSEYYRDITHAMFENTRVTKRGKIHAVSNYAGAGPFELWVMQRGIEGVAASADWEKARTQPKCPEWKPSPDR